MRAAGADVVLTGVLTPFVCVQVVLTGVTQATLAKIDYRLERELRMVQLYVIGAYAIGALRRLLCVSVGIAGNVVVWPLCLSVCLSVGLCLCLSPCRSLLVCLSVSLSLSVYTQAQCLITPCVPSPLMRTQVLPKRHGHPSRRRG